MTKNCHNCKHLEWVAGEASDGEGYCCNNREYKNAKEESKHLQQLDDVGYLSQPKSCCELVQPNS